MLDEAIRTREPDGLLRMNYTFERHLELSSLLVNRGFEPLTAFFCSDELDLLESPDVRFGPEVPEMVAAIERIPFDALASRRGADRSK